MERWSTVRCNCLVSFPRSCEPLVWCFRAFVLSCVRACLASTVGCLWLGWIRANRSLRKHGEFVWGLMIDRLRVEFGIPRVSTEVLIQAVGPVVYS